MSVDNPPVEEDADVMHCPKCGAGQEDLDGFGVLYCEACGYCTHASINGEMCGLCGLSIKTEESKIGHD